MADPMQSFSSTPRSRMMDRHRLTYSAVRLQLLDAKKNPIQDAVATGFLRRIDGRLYLYTCWHVVTGFDPYNVQQGKIPKRRRFMEVQLQCAQVTEPGVQVIGGLQTVVVPLYYGDERDALPRWEQDDQHVPDFINTLNIHVPFWHDAVRLLLPEVEVSGLQVMDEEQQTPSLLSIGDKCYVVGYPYGYSSFGMAQPTPVALVRFVAAERVAGRVANFLLEGVGAKGMSGGPVFVENQYGIYMAGIYTGAIYPDHAKPEKDWEIATALGTVCSLHMHFPGHLAMVERPSKPVPRLPTSVAN